MALHYPRNRPVGPSPSFRRLLGITLGAGALALGMQALGVLQLLEWTALDQWFRLRPAEPIAAPVVVVSINDEDIAASGQWPMSDRQLANLLIAIKAYQPAVIGLDLYRDLAIAPGTDRLNEVFTTTPNLIGIEKIVGRTGEIAISPPKALAEKGQVAFSDLVLDADGHVRRHLISLRYNGDTRLSLGTALALHYLENCCQIAPKPLRISAFIWARRTSLRYGQTQGPMCKQTPVATRFWLVTSAKRTLFPLYR